MKSVDRIPVAFYRSAGGAEPVRDCLQSLQKDDRRLVGTDLLRVQEQWLIGMPVCRAMGACGRFEVLLLAIGFRVMFCFGQGRVVVLHGFIKKTRQTPADDLALARKRMKDVMS